MSIKTVYINKNETGSIVKLFIREYQTGDSDLLLLSKCPDSAYTAVLQLWLQYESAFQVQDVRSLPKRLTLSKVLLLLQVLLLLLSCSCTSFNTLWFLFDGLIIIMEDA